MNYPLSVTSALSFFFTAFTHIFAGKRFPSGKLPDKIDFRAELLILTFVRMWSKMITSIFINYYLLSIIY